MFIVLKMLFLWIENNSNLTYTDSFSTLIMRGSDLAQVWTLGSVTGLSPTIYLLFTGSPHHQFGGCGRNISPTPMVAAKSWCFLLDNLRFESKNSLSKNFATGREIFWSSFSFLTSCNAFWMLISFKVDKECREEIIRKHCQLNFICYGRIAAQEPM